MILSFPAMKSLAIYNILVEEIHLLLWRKLLSRSGCAEHANRTVSSSVCFLVLKARCYTLELILFLFLLPLYRYTTHKCEEYAISEYRGIGTLMTSLTQALSHVCSFNMVLEVVRGSRLSLFLNADILRRYRVSLLLQIRQDLLK